MLFFQHCMKSLATLATSLEPEGWHYSQSYLLPVRFSWNWVRDEDLCARNLSEITNCWDLSLVRKGGCRNGLQESWAMMLLQGFHYTTKSSGAVMTLQSCSMSRDWTFLPHCLILTDESCCENRMEPWSRKLSPPKRATLPEYWRITPRKWNLNKQLSIYKLQGLISNFWQK